MQERQQRLQTQSDARREMVLDVARNVFAELGIEGASIREIARRAGYTPGAIYSYFESKEAIYGALLGESLERLNACVSLADVPGSPAQRLQANALAWFDFYASNPHVLDLGFYLARGMQPRGLTSELNQQLNRRLRDSMAPAEAAMVALGLPAEAALRENTALFAHGVGLLLLQHTGRIRMFGQEAKPLFGDYLRHLAQRLGAPLLK
ncbi:MAG: TetR/AcrR family transcriptional regulator [Burkholderiaceae bacterium]